MRRVIPSVPLHDTSGEPAERGVSFSFRNGVTACLRLSRHHLVNGSLAVMPDHFMGIAPVDKPSGIQSIVVIERICQINILLKPCVESCVRNRLHIEIHMEPRPRAFPVLFLHMMPAERNGIADILILVSQALRRDPVIRIIRVVVVHIHHHAVRTDKVIDAPVIVLVLGADMVMRHSRLQPVSVRYLFPVRIHAVTFPAGRTGSIKSHLHSNTSAVIFSHPHRIFGH